MPDWEEIAKGSFTRRKLNGSGLQSPIIVSKRFFKVWTAKEAYVKASGRGLAHLVHSFAVVGPKSQQEYFVTWLQLPKGYAGAVAYTPPRCEIRWRWWRGKQDSGARV